MTTQYKIRFIHKGHHEKTAIPTTWGHPRLDDVFEGCQVLGLAEAMEIIESEEHVRDDWFQKNSYGHVAIMEVSGRSGDSGPLKYWSVTEDDIESMHIIEYSDSAIGWALMEIAEELADEGEGVEFDEMGFPAEGWWDEVGTESIVARLVEQCEEVEPTFVEYD